jgi:Fe(3+) dicitrate transport protein
LSKNTKLQFISSAVIGQRKSVLFDRPASVIDTINPNTLQYNNRQVDIDRFNSFTQELKVLQHYKIGSFSNVFVAGIQLINNDLHRTQLGKGTTGTDYDLTLVDPIWGRDLHFKTKNVAFFAEHNWNINQKIAINFGARYELGESRMSGKIVYYPENEIPVVISRQFPLLGASFEYKLFKNTAFYGGFSQAYRPMLFKDIIPSSIFEKVDPNIKDAYGYNLEFGFRGDYKFLKWDVTGFVLQYNNRFGTLALTDSLGNFYTYRTNIGNSTTKGLEIFIQGNWKLFKNSNLILFTSTSIMDGKYTSGSLRSGNQNVSLVGKKIDSVPTIITRNGLTFQVSAWSFTFLMSHTGKSFADPLNTELPNANGTIGLVPGYTLFDFNTSFKISKTLELKAGINNFTNKQYFTKRPLFYPGPGVWSSDGRNITFTAIVRL